jgi:hypothetical protein
MGLHAINYCAGSLVTADFWLQQEFAIFSRSTRQLGRSALTKVVVHSGTNDNN